MNKDFSHLKKEQLISLRDRYYAGEIVKDLEKEYELSFPLSSRISQLPPIEYQQYSCPYCGIAMISPCQTRRHIDRMEHSMYCPSCKHHPNRYVECNCDNCRRVKSDQLDAKKEEMRRYFSISRPSIDFHSLSLENKIYLGALCAAQLSEDLGYIRSLKSTKATLTPTDEMNRHLYRSLLESGVISVSPDSPISAFDLEHPNFPNVFDEDKVQYSLNLQWPENPSTLISEILQPTYYHPESMHEDAQKLFTNLAISECIAYLLFQMHQVRFTFSPGEKTYKTFELILRDFSVYQVYGIIWKAVAESSKLYLEHRYTKPHAANIVITSCGRYADRARINQWNLSQYHRPRELPISSLSQFFYYKVLKIGDKAYSCQPILRISNTSNLNDK